MLIVYKLNNKNTDVVYLQGERGYSGEKGEMVRTFQELVMSSANVARGGIQHLTTYLR